MAAAPPKQRQRLLARKMKKHAKAAMASAAPRVAKAAAMANAVKEAVMAAVVVAMAAVVNAAKVLHKAKSAHPAKVAAVVKVAVKVATNCVKAKPAQHAANALSVVSAQNVLPVTVLPVKAVAMVVARTAAKAETKVAAMQRPS